jgi:hypothetical protein
MSCGTAVGSSRPTAISPDEEALVPHGADYGKRLDRNRDRILRAKLKFLTEFPAMRATASRKICSSFVGRYGEQFFIAALK